jgi:hypothetical protein
MKKINILIYLVFYSFSLFSQTEFMPIGFKMKCNVGGMLGLASQLISAEKDTLIKGTQVRKLTHKHAQIQGRIDFYDFATFIKQKGDSIFQYNIERDSLEFLFKNKYAVGDSLNVRCFDKNPKMVVDSIFKQNGTTRYVIKGNFFNQVRYFYLYDAFGPTVDWRLRYQCLTDPPIFTPICYRFSSNSTPFVVESRYSSFYNCDLIMSSDEKWTSELSMNPNPSDSFLQLDWGHENTFSKIELINIQGQILKSCPISTENSLRLDVQTTPSGIYFLHFRNKENNTIVKKVVIQH